MQALCSSLLLQLRPALPWSYELRVIRKDGTAIPVRATATPLIDEHGNHLATTVVSYDSTEQIRHQEIAARLAAIVETSHEAIFSTDPDGVTVRAWRHALRDACRRANVPHRLLHDCRRTAARNLVRAGVPERVAMLLTGHKTRAVFDRYNIVNERELLQAGERLVEYLGRDTAKKRRPARQRHTANINT